MPNIAGATVAVYFRCSEDRNDQASVSEQEELGDARCEAEGWTPRKYRDNDRSASRYARKDRDDWLRLLADLRGGLFAIIWLWESSRGDRKLYEWVGFLELCRDRGVRIYVETHGRLYDMRNARDMKTLAEDGVNNAYASDETSQRVQRHLAASARKGLPHGPVPYGLMRLYHEKTGKYAGQRADPPRSEIAAGIITRIARNVPLYRIEKELADAQVPPPRGQAWCAATLRKMARNPAYAGYRITEDGPVKIKDSPLIVTLDTHLAAVAVLDSQKRPLRDPACRPGSQKHLLSYMAICGACGSTLHVQKKKYPRARYSCCARGCVFVDVEWLDGLVRDLLCAHLARPGFADLYRSDSEEAARQRAEAAALRAQLDDWAAADISARAYAVREAKLLPRIEAAERGAAAAGLPLVLRELLAADSVQAGWDALGIPARRAVIRALMDVKVARSASQKRADLTDPDRVVPDWKREGA